MPHVDEGTLHALLDGELEPREVQQVQTHFATCPACQARLDEARHMMEETDRLLKALEPQPARPSGPRAEPPRVMVPPPPLGEQDSKSPFDPMVLIPDNPLPSEVRRRRVRTAAWAAGILVAFAAGGFGVKAGLLSDKPTGELRLRPEEFEAAGSSPQEARGAPVAATSAPAGAPIPAPVPAPVAPTHDSAKAPVAPTHDSAKAPAQKPAATPTPAPAADAGAAAGAESSEAAPEPPPEARAREERKPESRPTPAKTAPPPSRESDQSADDAMRALDRQKAADASRRALAAIDADRRARQSAAPPRDTSAPAGDTSGDAANASAPPPPPQPPTLEQRSQITSRIGLDEATRLLGGPLHAIDAADYTRQFVGIVSGASVPGADPSRPVVRAVYVDRSGRLLYLDQQRVRPGQADDLPTTPPEGLSDHRWVAGATLLRLHGDRSPAALDTLAQRVR